MTLTILALSGMLVALMLIVLGFHGRVVQRGVFCRRCRFDLTGIEVEQPGAACPECGGDLSRARATRATLRHKRGIVLALGLLLLLAGGTLLGMMASNNTARVLGVLPDRVVLTLHALGLDAAYTEIVTNRLTQPKPLSEDAWGRLIKTALDHQGDVGIAWDPRDGEVLLQAFTSTRLTPDQIQQYFENGLDVYAQFPDEIRHGAGALGVTLTVRPTGRISSLSGTSGPLSDGTDTVWNRLGITAGGLVDPVFETAISSTAGFTGMHIPGPTGAGSGSIGGSIPLEDLDWESIEPGEEHHFFIHYNLRVQRMSDGYIHYQSEGIVEQPVRIKPSDSQIVALDTSPDLIAAFGDHAALRLGPLHMRRIEHENNGRVFQLGRLNTICDNLPIVVAGQVFVISDGREHEVGEVTLQTLGGFGLSAVHWTNTDLPEPVIDAWLEAGSVTIEIRPDPRLAERTPGIKRILGLPLRFEDVVVTSEPAPSFQSSMPSPDQRTGRVVTEPRDD